MPFGSRNNNRTVSFAGEVFQISFFVWGGGEGVGGGGERDGVASGDTLRYHVATMYLLEHTLRYHVPRAHRDSATMYLEHTRTARWGDAEGGLQIP